MAPSYRYGFQRASGLHQEAAREVKIGVPVMRSLPLYLPEVKRGERQSLRVSPALGCEEELVPRYFVYTGTPEMWLTKHSYADGREIVLYDLPCDTFRPGAPHEVSWAPIHQRTIYELQIENRRRGRNSPTGCFVGRLVCELKSIPPF